MSGHFDATVWANIKDTADTKTKNFRGLKESTAKKYGVYQSFDEETGEVNRQYYPITKNGVHLGVKIREVPKNFSSRGLADATCDLFGQSIHTNSVAKQVIIASGELDCLSIYQMMSDFNRDSKFSPPAVVSAIVGERSSLKQYQNSYEFLNSFEKIYICPDQDTAGEEALHAVAKVLPRDKLFVISLPRKDANEMLVKGDSAGFVSAYFKAKSYSPSGIVGSDLFYDELIDSFDTKKLSLPPFMHDTQENMLAGGLEFPAIVNIVAPTGVGKCLAPGTLVRKADLSLVKVEDICVGDRLIRPDGLFNTVLSLANGREKMYRVDQSFGQSYTVNESHILSLKTCMYASDTFKSLPVGHVVNISILEYLKLSSIDKRRLKGYKASLPNAPKNLTPFFSVPLSLLSPIRIIELEEGEYFGFTLDGDRLFCLEDFTVTHNTTVVNELLYYWMFEESDFKIGLLSLELNKKQYAKVIASRHLQRKLSLIKDQKEAQLYLQTNKDKVNEVFLKEDGTPRFYFMEELDGKLSRIKELCEQMIISCGCQIIVIDPIQDLFEGLGLPEQEDFVRWLKIMIKSYEVMFICINHIRKQKSEGGKDKKDDTFAYNENEVMGSGSIIKSSFFTLLLNRNKYLDKDDPESNVLNLMVSKNRMTGITGPASSLYYDNVSHTLHDLESFKINNPDVFKPEVDYEDE